jgi:hypothetical protein
VCQWLWGLGIKNLDFFLKKGKCSGKMHHQTAMVKKEERGNSNQSPVWISLPPASVS